MSWLIEHRDVLRAFVVCCAGIGGVCMAIWLVRQFADWYEDRHERQQVAEDTAWPELMAVCKALTPDETDEAEDGPRTVIARIVDAVPCWVGYHRQGWRFAYEPGTHFVAANHPDGGKQSIVEIVATESLSWDRAQIGEAIAAMLNDDSLAEERKR